ncbi:MAG: DUF1203 domain-containing protein [Actinomycetota bacterium]
MTTIEITGIDGNELTRVLDDGVDHGGNVIEPFIDPDGRWPLRCCLRDSRAGDTIAVIAWSPFPWRGAYAEVGPIVVHAGRCPGTPGGEGLSEAHDRRPMTLRPYGFDRRIAYAKVRSVPAGASVTSHLHDLLDDPDVDFVHGRNTTGGCFSFQATRSTPPGPAGETGSSDR